MEYCAEVSRSLRRAKRRARLVRGALWTSVVANAGMLLLLALAFAVPLPARTAPWSQSIEYRDGRPAHIFLAADDKWRLPVTLADVDPAFVRALTALEDRRFWHHDGVDPLAIGRAIWTDLRHGRRVSGGSTITMQLARLLEPRPRTYRSKLVELFRATQLDLRLGKREILEAYLSRTPYGGNVEGVASAAWTYFGHGPAHLTPLEIATLLAVPQGPARFAPRAANTARLRARRDAILAGLIADGVVSGADAAMALVDAAATAPPDHLRAMPREAPHATQALRDRTPGRTRVRSTLDGGIQAIVERTVALRAPDLQRRGITSGAVVVIDHHTREVVALVGSLDWRDPAHGGQIAMFDRARSPGSTLKPLLYALAIDRGLALPGYLVSDVPTQYGTYRPNNFDGQWQGLVTLADALTRSLNLPFVDLLARFGVDRFLGELRRMGIASARTSPGVFGLSLVVGGIEVTPLELGALYATLAGDGEYRPLRLVLDPAAPAPAATRIFGAGAAYLTRQALSLRDRPDVPHRRALTGLPVDIHWKTGTSFGFRDAWAVGSGPTYTAVVWTGNVDRTGSAELVGSEAAGPLLFDVLEALSDHARARPPSAVPDDLGEIEVCAYSGHLPGPACTDRVRVLAPLRSVPTEPCPYHHAYDVDPATGLAVLQACRVAGVAYVRTSFTILPSAVVAWLVAQHRAVPELPVFAPACSADLAIAPPEITSPVASQVVTLIAGVAPGSQRIALAATTRASSLSWFVDGALVATVPSSERVYWIPTPGAHVIVATDDAGHRARRTLVVR